MAIGKKGQNVRLASILTEWEIDILDINEYEGSQPKKEVEEKIEANTIEELGLDEKLIESLKVANLSLVQQLKGLSVKDLSEVEGIDEEGAKAIETAVKKSK